MHISVNNYNGYHVFRTTYESNIGDKLTTVGEANDQCDRCAVSILRDRH